MDLQSMLTNAVAAGRNERMKTSKQLTLGELILLIEPLKKTYIDYQEKEQPKNVVFNFEYIRPTGLDSWRGSYAELAIEFSSEGEYLSVEKFLSMLKEAIGKTYTGYKGGEFVMGKSTPLWVANYGNSGNTGVVGIKDDEYEVILLTDYC